MICILARRGRFLETILKTERGVASRGRGANRTAGGPDPDRQAYTVWRGQSLPAPVPLPEPASWVRIRKPPRWSAERGPGRTGTAASAVVALRKRDRKKSAPVGAPSTPRSGADVKRREMSGEKREPRRESEHRRDERSLPAKKPAPGVFPCAAGWTRLATLEQFAIAAKCTAGARSLVPRDLAAASDANSQGRPASMARINLDVNGKVQTIDADPDMPLLYALRNDLGLNNPHFGCGLAQCGACTVHVDGQADALLRHAGVGGGQRQGRDARRPRHAGEAASDADRLCRGAGAAMRLLHQRLDHDGGRRCSTRRRSRPTPRSRTRSPASNAAAARI